MDEDRNENNRTFNFISKSINLTQKQQSKPGLGITADIDKTRKNQEVLEFCVVEQTAD